MATGSFFGFALISVLAVQAILGCGSGSQRQEKAVQQEYGKALLLLSKLRESSDTIAKVLVLIGCCTSLSQAC